MRLIGSRTEKEMREQLKKSNDFFKTPSRLRSALESQGHKASKAMVLHWTPDQTEDIYVVLIEGAYIVSVELDRANQDATPICERIELNDYKHRLSRVNLIQLAVAQELASAKT